MYLFMYNQARTQTVHCSFRRGVEPSKPPSPIYLHVDNIHTLNVLLLEHNFVFNITN